EREQQAVRGQGELAQDRREPEAVDQPEAKAHQPPTRNDRSEEQILGGDQGDRERDDGFHEARRQYHHVERGEREREAVGERERGDDLRQRQPVAAAEQQDEQEEQMVPARQDVLDAESHEAQE